MNKIIATKKIKELADKLSSDSSKNVKQYFPIDRFFIDENNYLEKIKNVEKLEFIFYNLENINPKYTIQLFVCLPELWENIKYEDIISLVENFTNSFSFYSLIGFTYKYLEIDLLDEIFLNQSINLKFKKDCINYFPNIIATFYMDENDIFDFENNAFGIKKHTWDAIKEKIHKNDLFKKSLPISQLSNKLKNYPR